MFNIYLMFYLINKLRFRNKRKIMKKKKKKNLPPNFPVLQVNEKQPLLSTPSS